MTLLAWHMCTDFIDFIEKKAQHDSIFGTLHFRLRSKGDAYLQALRVIDFQITHTILPGYKSSPLGNWVATGHCFPLHLSNSFP